jgi:hypothetical protein
MEIIPPTKILRSTQPFVVEDLGEEEWQAGVTEALHNALAEEGCVIIGDVKFSKARNG